MVSQVPVDELVAGDASQPVDGTLLGQSREGRGVLGWRLGQGSCHVSLIAGCHADEPVGPETLRRLVALLASLQGDEPLLTDYTWLLVPDANPDGAERNAAWARRTVTLVDSAGKADRGFDLAAYALGVVRELPGDDVEFGFPRSAQDSAARPENRAIAAFLAAGAPFSLHGTLHGMGLAPGPWFLLEPAWIERTGELRDDLRRLVGSLGYGLLDIDRQGDKGFVRIDEGFSTRPDSRAMAAHFMARDEPETAELFRPSSMEYVRGLGGDPLTFVSEMPLFLMPEPAETTDPRVAFRAGTAARLELHHWLDELARRGEGESVRRAAAERGIRPMPIRDQMRLQVGLVNAGLRAIQVG
ncbi:MAG: M14 family zinc carboxypeptidase [Acidobacteria bacterium]|nr:M14 family zinc carboxypeptidase [Acidobacteriota bacterium]